MKVGQRVRTDPDLRPHRFAGQTGTVTSEECHGEIGVSLDKVGSVAYFRPIELEKLTAADERKARPKLRRTSK